MSHGGSKRLTSWPKKNRLRKRQISLIQTQVIKVRKRSQAAHIAQTKRKTRLKIIMQSKRRIAISPTPIARNSNKPMMKQKKLKRILQTQIVMITRLMIRTKVQTQALTLRRKTISKMKWKGSYLWYQSQTINKMTMIRMRIKMKMRKVIRKKMRMRMRSRTRNRLRKRKRREKRTGMTKI